MNWKFAARGVARPFAIKKRLHIPQSHSQGGSSPPLLSGTSLDCDTSRSSPARPGGEPTGLAPDANCQVPASSPVRPESPHQRHQRTLCAPCGKSKCSAGCSWSWPTGPALQAHQEMRRQQIENPMPSLPSRESDATATGRQLRAASPQLDGRTVRALLNNCPLSGRSGLAPHSPNCHSPQGTWTPRPPATPLKAKPK